MNLPERVANAARNLRRLLPFGGNEAWAKVYIGSCGSHDRREEEEIIINQFLEEHPDDEDKYVDEDWLTRCGWEESTQEYPPDEYKPWTYYDGEANQKFEMCRYDSRTWSIEIVEENGDSTRWPFDIFVRQQVYGLLDQCGARLEAKK